MVNERRIELGMSKRQVITKAEVGNKQWLALENDGTAVADHMWARMAKAIGWSPRSFRQVLAGGDPEPIEEPADVLADRLDDLERRVERLETGKTND